MPWHSINMKIQTIASGSKGNCTILICGDTKLIIDIGISFLNLKNVLSEQNLELEEFNGLLITHCHKDHIKGLSTFAKKTNIIAIATAMVPQQSC